MIKPFEKEYTMTQDWNDPRYRASYTRFGLLGHNGQDFGCPINTKIIAPHDGKIIENLLDSTGYGWYIKIENDKEGSILGHFNSQSPCKVGSIVKQGDMVGLSGNSGNSTGPHLHWGYYRFPRKRDNGFSGTVDQTHWIGLETFEDEMLYERAEKEKYKKEARDLRKVTQSQAESIGLLNKEIESLNKAKTDQAFEIAQIKEDKIKLSTERDSLLKCCEGYEVSVPKLTARIKELEAKLISQDPLKDFTAKELWSALFDKIFKRGGE